MSHVVVEAGVKAVPLMVIMKPAPPALSVAGERLVMAGEAESTMKVAEGDQPAPLMKIWKLIGPALAIKLDGIFTVNCVSLR